ncbi:MAG: caspase family protein [Hyphomicrobiaceae bacterium]|nr:caspase family protein [Hyphomicrobiaceae bacterium]
MRRLIAFSVVALRLALANATAIAESRVALVVGNSGYQNAPALANPINDARDMSAALRAVGFDVVEALDTGRSKLDGALRVFTDKLARADVALFYDAGHGLQVRGGAELPGADRCQARPRAGSRVRDREARLRVAPDGA